MSNSAADQPSDPESTAAPEYPVERTTPGAEQHFQRLRHEHIAAHARLNAQPQLVFPVDSEASQFSLTTLLSMMAIASVVFALGRWCDPAIFAGLCGFAAILYPLIITLFARETRHAPLVQQGWLLLLAIYLMAIMLAIAHKV